VHDTVAEVRACTAEHQDDAPPTLLETPPEHGASPAPAPTPPPAGTDPVGFAGPDWLGRDAIVAPGQAVPGAWAAAPVVDVADVRRLVIADTAALRPLWDRRHARQRTVFVMADDLPAPAVVTGPAWAHPAELLLATDVLAHLVTANAVDLRPGRSPWPWAEHAVAAGGRWGGPADVLLPDGTPAWCDGGPPTWFRRADTGGVAVVHRIALERGTLTPLLLDDDDAPDTELTPDQAAAVTHEGGAARVIAPAGSGKTRVLTARARHLLTHRHVPPSALCLVAFNTRAADEIRERTGDLPRLHVRTLNALGLAILDGTPPFAPRRRERRLDVLAETDVRAMLDALVTPARAAGTDPIATWIAALGDVRLRLRDPALVEADYDGDVDGLPGVVERYRELLAERGAVDFDEQIIASIELLLRDPEARAAAQRACRFLLVDEFQDLAPAHLLLLRLVASPELSVFGVGDDDQTIYGFSGATPEWLIGYDRLFPGAGHHPLTVNFRCPPDVVAATGRLLVHNVRRVAKDIAPARDEPAGLTVRRADDVTAATGASVAAALDTGAVPADVVVLARVNSALVGPQVELRRLGIPVVPAVGLPWLQRTGVRAALAWLRLAGSPRRLASGDVAEAARRPSAGRSRTLVGWMAEQADVSALHALAGRLKADRDRAKVLSFVDLLERVTARVDGTTDGLVAALGVLRGAGLDDTLDALDRYRHDLTRAAHLDDFDSLVDLARRCPDPGAFPAWLRAELSRPGDEHGVRLSTVHRVKGLEWPHVVVHDASDALFPHRLTIGQAGLEEERRVFHVAITRCRSTCTVVAPAGSVSPFVAELEGASPAIRLRAAAAAPAEAPASTRKPAGPPTELEEALRTWRTAQARQEARPPFVILHDSTLREIAARRPATLFQLGAVPGIGPAKLERYGDDILAVVAATGNA
jgi:DNA helicase-2/ATP-dependent DNA helicase PcrA